MSLRTDQFFYSALSSSPAITDKVQDRIFNPARTTVDENEDRIPYLIITMDGVTNDESTKDDVEGQTDTVEIGVLCVADDRESLADLTEAVRMQMVSYLHQAEEGQEVDDAELAPYDWSFSASAVMYDEMKPCVYQSLRYVCGTRNF